MAPRARLFCVIIHVYHFMGKPDDETRRRMAVARESWEREYNDHRGTWLAPALSFSRNSLSIGDPQPVPFIRDMIAQGMAYAADPKDVLFLTNADVGFAQGITPFLKVFTPIHMRRRDFNRIDRVLDDEDIVTGTEYPGADGFAFTAEWWKDNREIFPDMLLGRYGWDSCFRNLIRRGGGIELKSMLWHESHASQWNETAYDIEQMPGNRHNRRLLLEWIATYGGSTEDHLYPDISYK